MRSAAAVFLLTMVVCFSLIAQNGPKRYRSKVFDQVKITTVQYDQQRDFRGTPTVLNADVYTPENDDVKNRPLIVFLHGGGFKTGSRDLKHIQHLCKRLAQGGFVVASIDYRLGFYKQDAESVGQALIRGVQDLSSFVRYAKANANNWGIDPNLIFVSGGSSGGSIALSYAFLDYGERASYLDTVGVGSYTGRGNLNGQPPSIAGVYSLWGGVSDTNWINKGDVPVGCIQSKYDKCVPWEFSKDGCGVEGFQLYGSSCINKRAKHLGIKTSLYGFESDEHSYGLKNKTAIKTTIREMGTFFYEVMVGK